MQKDFSVTYVGSDHGGDCYGYQPMFAINDTGGERVGSVTVALTSTALVQLGLVDRPESVNSVLLMYAVSRIEEVLTSDGDPHALFDDGSTSARWLIDADHVAAVFLDSFHTKECAYQIAEGQDLYCAAASRDDETLAGSVDGRLVAPTSRPICDACGVPDRRLICTAFSHPLVTGTVSNGPPARMLARAMCNEGSANINESHRCTPGANACWRRDVVVARRAAATATAPLHLAEALDFLDATWRMTGKGPLVRPSTFSDAAGLAMSCSSREEFEPRMSDVADALDRIRVEPSEVPVESRAVDGHLNRFLATLLALDNIDQGLVTSQIQVLQRIRGLRHTQGHSGASRDRPRILRELGIPDSGAGNGETLELAKNAAANAVLALRSEIRRVTG
jgi:hypothetical protein